MKVTDDLVRGGQGRSGGEVYDAAFGWGICVVVLGLFVVGVAVVSGLL